MAADPIGTGVNSDPVVTRIDYHEGWMMSCPSVGAVVSMIHRGVEYFLTATAEPDIWHWRFQIGDKVKTGKTQTRLATLAERRVQLKIDAALKALGTATPLPRNYRKLKAIQSGAEEH